MSGHFRSPHAGSPRLKHTPLSRAIASGLSRGRGVPQDVWQYLKLCLADAVGIAFASRHYEFSRNLSILLGYWVAWQLDDNRSARACALRDAALMNGLLIHGLDYDATSRRLVALPAFLQRWR